MYGYQYLSLVRIGLACYRLCTCYPCTVATTPFFKTKLKVRDKRQTGSSELLASCRFLWFGKGGEGGGARGLV